MMEKKVILVPQVILAFGERLDLRDHQENRA